MVVDIVIVVVLIVAIIVALFGWDRYRGGHKGGPSSTAQPTDELFIDPESGQRMRVWFDATTGEREYRPE